MGVAASGRGLLCTDFSEIASGKREVFDFAVILVSWGWIFLDDGSILFFGLF